MPIIEMTFIVNSHDVSDAYKEWALEAALDAMTASPMCANSDMPPGCRIFYGSVLLDNIVQVAADLTTCILEHAFKHLRCGDPECKVYNPKATGRNGLWRPHWFGCLIAVVRKQRHAAKKNIFLRVAALWAYPALYGSVNLARMATYRDFHERDLVWFVEMNL